MTLSRNVAYGLRYGNTRVVGPHSLGWGYETSPGGNIANWSWPGPGGSNAVFDSMAFYTVCYSGPSGSEKDAIRTVLTDPNRPGAKGKAWSLSNEPNLYVTAGTYASWVKEYRDWIRTYDSTAKIMTGGICQAPWHIEGNQWLQWVTDLITAMDAMGTTVDIWGIHPYYLEDNDYYYNDAGGSEALIAAFRKKLEGYPEEKDKPIWILEVGYIWGNEPREICAAGLKDLFAWIDRNAARYKIERRFWFVAAGCQRDIDQSQSCPSDDYLNPAHENSRLFYKSGAQWLTRPPGDEHLRRVRTFYYTGAVGRDLARVRGSRPNPAASLGEARALAPGGAQLCLLGSDTPAETAGWRTYLPYVQRITFDSTQVKQFVRMTNHQLATVSGTLYIYRANGTVVKQVGVSVAPRRYSTIPLWDVITEEFTGWAYLDVNGPLAVNTNIALVQGAQYKGVDTYAGIPTEQLAPVVYFPQFQRQYYGWESIILVCNPYPVTIKVQADFHNTAGVRDDYYVRYIAPGR